MQAVGRSIDQDRVDAIFALQIAVIFGAILHQQQSHFSRDPRRQGTIFHIHVNLDDQLRGVGVHRHVAAQFAGRHIELQAVNRVARLRIGVQIHHVAAQQRPQRFRQPVVIACRLQQHPL